MSPSGASRGHFGEAIAEAGAVCAANACLTDEFGVAIIETTVVITEVGVVVTVYCCLNVDFAVVVSVYGCHIVEIGV